ncbi:MAG: PAS domain-containing protein [Novosphingobium sp.]
MLAIAVLVVAGGFAAWRFDLFGWTGFLFVAVMPAVLAVAILSAKGRIDARRKTMARAEVEQARAEISEALNNMSNGLLMVAEDGTIRLYNDRVEDMFHLEPGEIAVGMSLADYLRNIGCHVGWDAARCQRVIASPRPAPMTCRAWHRCRSSTRCANTLRPRPRSMWRGGERLRVRGRSALRQA